MIGTGIKKEPSRKTNPFKKKNAKGQSFKTIFPKPASDGGGGKEVAAVAKRVAKMPNGVGVSRTTAEPYRGKNSQGQSYKTAVDEWCKGTRKSYRA